MNIRYRAQGIILDWEDRLEADRVFSVLTKEFGMVALWVVSCRKISSKLRGGMRPFSCSDIEFIQGRNRKTVTDARSVLAYPLSGNLEGLRAAMRVVKTVKALVPKEDPDERVWTLVLDTLRACVSVASAREARLVYYAFFWGLAERLGYGTLAETQAMDAAMREASGGKERVVAITTRERFQRILVRS